MADLARIKNNVRKMVAQNAPEADIDGYIASEGVTVDEVRNFNPTKFGPATRSLEEARAAQLAGATEAQPATLPPVTGRKGLDAIGTFMAAMPEGVPIAGPLLDSAAMAASAGLGSMISGDPYAQVRAEMQAMKDRGNEENPWSRLGGNVAGGIATLGPIGATEAGGYALGARAIDAAGKALPLGGRVLRSSLSSGGISAADTAARGGDTADVIKSGAIGLGLGGAIPVAGAGISKGIESGADFLRRIIGTATNPTKEAERRLGSALSRDAATPGNVLNAADEAAARQAGVPLTNVDRGGETTRALARSVGNQSPEVRAAIENAASDRFAGQGARASSFISRIMGGNVDDLAFQQSLREGARAANKPAYDRAFAQPGAQAMWTPELQQLMQAPAMQRAAQQATTRGANRAAIEGFQPIRNPFTFQNGQVALSGKATPTLRFWDQTKRNLDSAIGRAQAARDNTLAGDLTALKSQLVRTLDAAVPEYQAARQGAAAFFGAEDALDAGRKFVMTPKAIPEARKAIQKFSPAERKAFATGYASELIDKIKAAPDRMNVVNSVFKSQAARESMELALGPQRMKQIEAYVRVESLVDRLRGAMGNSTTVRQLTELGLGAGAGGAYTGDLTGAFTGAALATGLRYGGAAARKRIEQNVMRELGALLTADDPAMVQRLVTRAAQSPRYMKALESIGNALVAPSRVGAIQTASPPSRGDRASQAR